MTSPLLPLPFFAALLAGLLAVGLMRSHGASQRSRRMFAIYLGVVGVLALLAGLRLGYHLRWAGYLQPVLAMTPGPLSYLAFRSLTAHPDPSWPRDLARHGWGVLLAMSACWLGWPKLPLDLLIATSFCLYAALLWRLRAQGPDTFVNASLGDAAMTMRLLSAVIALHLISALVDVAVSVDIRLAAGRHAGLILAAAHCIEIGALCLALFARSGGPIAAPAVEAAAAQTPSQPADAGVVAEVRAILERQRLYLDPDLTITRLAKRAGLPARRVSEAINHSFGVNVSQFINGYRVSEAQRLLRETGLPITEIMLAAGFQTKSNFNREFRRLVGGSPSAFRQDQRAGRTELSAVEVTREPTHSLSQSCH